MKPVTALGFALCLTLPLITTAVFAGDARRGQRIAEQRCEACHIIGPSPRNEVGEAPPFEVIGQHFDFDDAMLVYALVGPHAKMNFSLSRPEADDVAAYIATLKRQLALQLLGASADNRQQWISKGARHEF